MATNWTEYPERVETFGDLNSILETLGRHEMEVGFTAQSFGNSRGRTTAYTVDFQNRRPRFNPHLDQMPGLERLLDRFDINGHFTLTLDLFRELRNRAANALKSNRTAVDAMTFIAVADVLDAGERPPAPPTPAAGERTPSLTIVISDDGTNGVSPRATAPRPGPAGAFTARTGRSERSWERIRPVTSTPPPPEPPSELIEAAALRLCEAMAGDEFGSAAGDGERFIFIDVAQRGPGIEPSPFNREQAAAFHHAACWLVRINLVTVELFDELNVKKDRGDRVSNPNDASGRRGCLKSTPELWRRCEAGRIFGTAARVTPPAPLGVNPELTSAEPVNPSPINYTMNDIRDLLRYQRELAQFEDWCQRTHKPIVSVTEYANRAYSMAWTTPQPGRLTAERAAGLAAYRVLDPEGQTALGLGPDSRVLAFNTEGATDPAVYAALIAG